MCVCVRVQEAVSRVGGGRTAADISQPTTHHYHLCQAHLRQHTRPHTARHHTNTTHHTTAAPAANRHTQSTKHRRTASAARQRAEWVCECEQCSECGCEWSVDSGCGGGGGSTGRSAPHVTHIICTLFSVTLCVRDSDALCECVRQPVNPCQLLVASQTECVRATLGEMTGLVIV